MESNSRGAKMLLIALKKQEGNTEEWQIKKTSSAPSAELNTDSMSGEDLSLKSGNVLASANQSVTIMGITSNTSRSSSIGSRTGSSPNSSSSSEDNDDTDFDRSYAPPNVSSESDSDGDANSNAGNFDTNNADTETPSTSGISLGSTRETSNFSDTPSLMILTSPLKKGVKRKRNEKNWIRNLNKKLRNSGKAYEMHTPDNKTRKERQMRPPCTEKCKLKCSMGKDADFFFTLGLG